MHGNDTLRPPAISGVVMRGAGGFGPPIDRMMTEDERRGFNWACEAQQLWGSLMLANVTPPPADCGPVPLVEAINHGWRMVVNSARALQLTMGRDT